MFCDNMKMINYVFPVTSDNYDITAKTNIGHPSFAVYFKSVLCCKN